jgi:hypothetical protein
MARPTILFNSSTGSDIAASGAGPSSALSGTGASLASSTSVDLSADAPDLSGVATDGSAAMWVATSSGRQFSRITAVDNGTKIVTVATTYNVTESGRTWGIGGKRATLDNANSRAIWSDVEAGWTIRLETDQSISGSGLPDLGANGDTTDGPIIVDTDGPIRTITQSANDEILNNSTNGRTMWRFRNLGFANSSATKTNAFAMRSGGNMMTDIVFEGCVFGDETNSLLMVLSNVNNNNFAFLDCEIKYCTTTGANAALHTNINSRHTSQGCWIHHNAGVGINVGVNDQTAYAPSAVTECLITDNGSHGVFSGSGALGLLLERCTIANNGGDGIRIGALNGWKVRNNCITGNGGYGINAQAGQDYKGLYDYNNLYGNTSGSYNNLTAGAHDTSLDPEYTNAAGGDFSVGTNLKAKGWPNSSRTIGANQSATTSYVDIGAAQREEQGAGGDPFPSQGLQSIEAGIAV